MSCTIAHCGCYTSFNIGESIVICTMIICVTILMYRILLMVRDWVEDYKVVLCTQRVSKIAKIVILCVIVATITYAASIVICLFKLCWIISYKLSNLNFSNWVFMKTCLRCKCKKRWRKFMSSMWIPVRKLSITDSKKAISSFERGI